MPFIEDIKDRLGFKAKGRKVIGIDYTCELRENSEIYGNMADVPDNTFLWDQ